MQLLSPWYLLGLAAVALPIAAHFLTRPRPRRLPLSTIRFVREALEQRRARNRLRDWIILLLRAAAVCLIVWAFARPLAGAKPAAAPAGGNAVRVVLLDQSQSMAAVAKGVSAFERARAAANEKLAFEPGLSANLILAAARPRPTFPTLSSNFSTLKESLAAASPRSESLNLKAALESAGQMLAHGPTQAPRELWIISDFQRSNWTSADFSSIPQDTQIHLQSVAPTETPDNLAILRAGATGRAQQGNEVRLEVDVGNYSKSPRDVIVQVSIASASYQLQGRCGPMGKTTLTGSAVLRAAGWQAGEARLLDVQDAIAADNTRPFVVQVHPPIVYALITRDSVEPHPSSSHFLELALLPTKPGANASNGRVVRFDPASLDREALSAADVIVLDHPGRLSSDAIKMLYRLMRLGRGVLYVACEATDASNLGVLSREAGADLRMPVEFAPRPAAQSGKLFITSERTADPLFHVFGDELGAALSPLRFEGVLASHAVTGGLGDDILASYDDQSASLVVTRCAAGTLAVLNADLSQSNLTSSPLFVPLTSELVDRLLSRAGAAREASVGEPLVRELPADAGAAASLTVTGPSAVAGANGKFADTDAGAVWRWAEGGPPGVYTVRRDENDLFAVAMTIPATEADLTPIDLSVLKDRLAGGRTVVVENADNSAQRRDVAWSWIASACAACMLLELAVLKFFKT